MRRFFLIYTLFYCTWSSAQETITDINKIKQLPIKTIAEQAESLYNSKSYEESYYYYKALSEVKKNSKLDDLYRLGKTALAAKKYDVAKATFMPLLPKANRYPLIAYEYALSLKYSGEYILAAQYFQYFLNKYQHESDNDYVKLAQSQHKSCKKILEEQENTGAWFLSDLTENDTSTNKNDTIYRGLTPAGKYQIGLIECQTSKGTCIKKVMPDNTIQDLKNSAGNPIFNSCSPHIAPDGETVFFAQQEIGKPDYKIFVGKMSPTGEIENIQKLGPGVNREGYSSTHPAIGLTEHGQQILYFSSTLPGSQGGYDIWYSIRTTDGEFTMSYNLGTRVNGTGDEITPFYYQNDGELYFSSEKPEGYGGLDVYKLTGEKKRWEEEKAQQLEFPVNSQGNDFHFKKDQNGDGSYSTDRGKKEKVVKFRKIVGA